MKIGIIREGKIPADNRVPLTPQQCAEVQQTFNGVEVVVQSSTKRCFSDDEYREKGIRVVDDISDCDVLLGVKEVPEDNLIPGKIYFFFSHTIKEQEYNRKLLQTVLKKRIQLIDYETLTDQNGERIIGFGRFAGLVGAYNGFRALGLRSRTFDLKPAHKCSGLDEMLSELNKVNIPAVKIAVTGNGRVAGGVLEILEFLNIEQFVPEQFLKAENPGVPVYAQLLPEHYVTRKDGERFGLKHFFGNPEMYENAFLPFAFSTDMLIAAAYWDPKSPVLFTEDDMRNSNFKITVISDITCDIDGSVPSTKRASTIEEPFYDFNPVTGKVDEAFSSESNITVQAIDNLPNELPKDASEDFGRNLIDKVFPSLFGNDNSGIIKRASITKDGKLTQKYSYLKDFAGL